MKYPIFVGYLATILAISASPLRTFENRCLEPPKKWDDALDICFENASNDTLESFMTNNKTIATREAKCLALCIYTESGEFADGRFDPIALENYLREYVGSHYLLEDLVKVHVDSANAGNAEEGDDCDKAYAYHAADDSFSQLVLDTIFCDFENSDPNQTPLKPSVN